MLHTDTSDIGAGAVINQVIGDEQFHFSSLQDATRAPIERECQAVLWAIAHYLMNLAGRRFTLVTDCSALTCLFQSRDLIPKLHRGVLCLMEYDFVLQ